MTTRYLLEAVLLPQGWVREALVSVSRGGYITAIESAAANGGARVRPGRRAAPHSEWDHSEMSDTQYVAGIVVPGMPNAHSHAFQRALVGNTEYRLSARDSFWTWRQAMYRLANRIEPADLRTLATQLFIEMLKAGYTSVAEFHYLHRQPNGEFYRGRNPLWDAIAEAAAAAGIALTFLPTLYQTSDFGAQPLHSEQRRFALDTAQFLRCIEERIAEERSAADFHAVAAASTPAGEAPALMPATPKASASPAATPTASPAPSTSATLAVAAASHLLAAPAASPTPAAAPAASATPAVAPPLVRTGAAFHSLRAVPLTTLREAAGALRGMDPTMPLHIHVAEQIKEVEACVLHTGRRPIEALLETELLDRYWCLVHATHATAAELQGIARSQAGVCVSISTEANLGDGFFDATRFLREGGRVCVGSDSQATVCPAEELRWMEYQQRLRKRRRGVLVDPSQSHTGTRLWSHAAQAGAQAIGQPAGVIAVGQRADWLVLDKDHPSMAGAPLDNALDHLLFAGAAAAIRDVMVAGRWVIKAGRHAEELRSRAHFSELMSRLISPMSGPRSDTEQR